MNSDVKKALSAYNKRTLTSNTKDKDVSAALDLYEKRRRYNAETELERLSQNLVKEQEAYNSYIKSNLTHGYGSEAAKDTLDKQRQSRVNISKIKRDIEAYKDILDEKKFNSLISEADSVEKGYQQVVDWANYFSQWEDENSYNNWVSAEKTKKEQLDLDLPTAQKEIDEMQKRASFLDDQIKGLKANQKLSNISVGALGQTQLYDPYLAKSNADNSDLLAKYQEEYEQLSQNLAKKKQYVSVAERLQSNAKLVNDAKNSEDFEQLSTAGLSIIENLQNTPSEENVRDVALRMSGSASSLITSQLNDWLYSTTGEGATADSKAKINALTEDEKKVYAYYLGKNDTESAKAYLDSMDDILTQRVSTGIFETQYEDNVGREMLFGVKAGLNQNREGIIGFANQIAGNEEYQAPSGTDYVSAFIRNDLSEEGVVHQGAYDLITTTSNMMPSILTSTLIGTVAPGIGQVVGAGMMGMTASGSAYQEMINLGYNKEQARTYGMLVGASETALGTLLGGISKLGGAAGTKVIPKALTSKFVSAADTAIGNLAIRYGSSMLSEFSEEALQEILDPVFQNIAVGYNLNDLSDIELSEVLYSGLLGALSAGILEGVGITADTVNTAQIGSSMKKAGNIESLKELGNTLSTDSVAYRIANKVNEKSSAYTIGKLFNEVGATLNEGNIASLKSNLISRGMSENDAQVLAEAYAYGVVNDTVMLTPAQEEVFKNNEVLATAVHEELIAKNNTYNQQVQRFFEIADSAQSKKVAKTTQNSTKPTTETVDGVNADTFEGAIENTVENDFKQTTYNGEAISFKYKSADAVELDNGETVSVEDITMSDDDAVFYDAIMGENDIFPEARFVNGKLTSGVNISTANEIRKIFGGTPTINQLKGVKMYYQYGMYNIKRFGESGALTETQERQVFNLGRALSESVAEKESNTPKVKKYSKGKVKYNVKSELTSRQQASVEVIEKLADMFNITFNLYESTLNENGERSSVMPNGEKTSANGYYMNGEIYVDINAGNNGQGAVLYTVAHELTHYIREWSPKKFKVLADFLVEQYESKGKSVDYYVNKQMEKARKSGNKNMKYSEAFEEFVADSMEKMLTDQNAVEKLAMLRTKDKSVFDKLRESIQKLVDRIKQEYAKLTPDSAEGRTVAAMTDVFSDIQDLFLEALDDASNNFQKTEINTITNDGVKMQIRNEYANEIDKWFKDGKPNEETFILGSTGDVLQGLGAIESDIYMLSDKINEILETHPEMTVDEIKKIPQILENPVLVLKSKNFGRNTKPNTRLVIFGSVKAKDGKPILSVLDLRPNEKNLIIEDMQKVTSAYTKDVKPVDFIKESIVLFADKSKTTKLLKSIGFKMPIELQKSGYIGSISYFNRSVNISGEKFSNIVVESNVKNSLRDSTGKELSAEQVEFFKNSKVRNSDGYLIPVYHGSGAEFTEFSYKYMSTHGSMEGQGFYFTDKKSMAEGYQKNGTKLMTGYLNIKKPLSDSELTLTRAEVIKLLKALDPTGDDVILNYDSKGGLGYPSKIWYNRAFTDTVNNLMNYNDTDSELLAELANASGGAEAVVKTVRKVLGYDGYIVSDKYDNATVYVAFESNQFKNIDNLNPTSNDDIRFSERGQSVYKLLGENQRLQKENARLKEKVKYLNDFVKLQRKITHGKIIDRRSTEAQARKIKKSTGSKIELSNLTDQLYSFYTLIISGSEDLVWDTVLTRASWIANDILNEIPESTQRDEYAQEILSYIRSKNIRLNDVQRAEVENIYDSYNAYRKRLMGSITISQKGTSLDSVWQDLAEQYPDTFSKDTNPADMPLELADIIHTLRNSYEVIEEYDKTEQVRWLAEQIYDTYWDVSTVESVMDKLSKEHQQQINALKMQHAERVKKIYAKHQEDLKDQKAYYQEMYKRLRERATASHKKQMLDYQDKVHEAQAKAIEKRNNTETRRQILKTLDKVEAKLFRPTKEKNIGLEMQPLACRLLTLANLDTVDADYRIERLNTEMENTTNPQVLNTLQTRIDNITKQGEKKAAELQQKRNKYKAIAADAQNSLQQMGKTVEIDEVIDKTLKDIEALVGGTPIRRMTSYQLECLKNAVNMVDGYIRADKQLFIDGKKQDVENMAQTVIHEVLGNSKKEKQFIKQLEWLNKFGWSMLKPETAFDLIGSSALSHLFQEARKGDDKFARSVSAAQIFLSENVKKYGADKWNMDERKEFMIQDEKVTLTLGEILSLYAYSKRDQAIPHLESGGFVQVEPVKKKIGGKINIEYTVYKDHAHRISEVELGSIINILTKEQIAFADVMQEYLSTVMGAKGNEISRELYQIELFKEKFYFPLKLSSVYKYFKENENSKTPVLKNAGMTKPTVTNANDPIILESFENVWTNHVVQMSRYNAYVLGIENLTKVFGYTGIDKSSVRAALQGTYGDAAIKYLENFIIDLNGGRKGMSHGDMVNVASKLLSTFKKVTVSASLSTAIQQPSSVIRAMSYVKPKYFLIRKNEKISHKDNWEELKKYAPIATLKEIGGYDMSSGINVADFIKQRDYKGKEKLTAFFKDSNYRDEILMWGASKGDELAWSALWHAIKKEQRYRFPNMEKEKFLKICGQRFTDVATKTQVYDSVFTRSEIMRSPSETNKMATSFMGEPMTNLNIIIDSVIQAKRGKITRPQAVWNISCVYIAQISAAALASIVYAMRDDDDDESFVEKYMSAFGNKVSDEILPITWIPYVRDSYSLCQGYDVSRTDMSVLSDLVESFQNLTNNNISLDEKITGVSGSIAAMFGVPLKNVIRDGKAVANTIEMMFDDNVAKSGDASKAFAEGIFGEKKMADANEYLSKGKTEKANELIADLLEEKTKKNISNGKTPEKAEKDAKSSIRSSLTSYWKPLFIKAYQEDDYIEQEEIYERLLSTGIYGTSGELKETIEKWVKDLQ